MRSKTWLTGAVERLIVSRILGAVFIANLVAMCVTYLASCPVWCTVPIWLLGLVGGLWLLRPRAIRRPRSQPKAMPTLALIAVVVLLLSAPRIFYPLSELPIPFNFTLPMMDDQTHLAMLVPMTLGNHYPLRHPSNIHELFSYYYAGFYPLVVLKLLLPKVSLESCLFVGHMLYALGLALSVVEVAARLFARQKTALLFLLFFLLYGDFGLLPDVLLNHNNLLNTHMWWQNYFDGDQIKPFFAGMMWVPHHLAAFYSLVLAWLFATQTRFVTRRRKITACGLLLAASFYMSPFVFIPALFFLVAFARGLWPVLIRSRYVLLGLMAATLPAIAAFMGKPSGLGLLPGGFRIGFTGNFWLDKALTFPFWYVIVGIVDLCGLPLALLLIWKDLVAPERRFAGAAIAYFITTYLLSFSGYNDYSMHGMFLPIFTMLALVMRHYESVAEVAWGRLPRTAPAACVLLLFLSLSGSAADYAAETFASLHQWSPLTRFIARHHAGGATREVTQLTQWMQAHNTEPNRIRRDRTIIVLKDPPPIRHSAQFLYEKFLDVPVSRMDEWETDLLGRPQTYSLSRSR